MIQKIIICKFIKKIVPLHDFWEIMKIILTILAIGGAMLLLSVGVILRKDKQFRSHHIAQNPRMKKDGIHCATSQDREARKKGKNLQKI